MAAFPPLAKYNLIFDFEVICVVFISYLIRLFSMSCLTIHINKILYFLFGVRKCNLISVCCAFYSN